jgi:HPt (histidine-containing phosphotransfer) domain-containing protein
LVTREDIQDHPLFDPGRILEIQRDLGPDTTRELLGHCMRSMDQHLAAVKRSTGAGDAVMAKRAAHDLKGICAQFGATRASEIARRIEVEIEDTGSMAKLMDELTACVTGAGEKIREIHVRL